jgi:hypothetical protein
MKGLVTGGAGFINNLDGVEHDLSDEYREHNDGMYTVHLEEPY